MTGKYPIHTGMQHRVLYGAEPRGLPLTEKLLPQYLEELGYENHIVGKWHLGSYTKEYTPLYRGFKSHLGIIIIFFFQMYPLFSFGVRESCSKIHLLKLHRHKKKNLQT